MDICESNKCYLCGNDLTEEYPYYIQDCMQDRHTICRDCLYTLHFQIPYLWGVMRYVENANQKFVCESNTNFLVSQFVDSLGDKLHEMWDKKEN